MHTWTNGRLEESVKFKNFVQPLKKYLKHFLTFLEGVFVYHNALFISKFLRMLAQQQAVTEKQPPREVDDYLLVRRAEANYNVALVAADGSYY